MPSERNIRIGNVSGATGTVPLCYIETVLGLTRSTGDAPHALARMVREGDVDVITGDWLSEMNIAWNAITKADNPDLGYEVGFYTQLSECIDEIAQKKVKVVTNAGALNAPGLSRRIEELCKERGLSLKVATVVGDDVTDLVTRRSSEGESSASTFKHLDHEEQLLDDWDPSLEPSCAAAYIGCWGIVAALRADADIVICGRVTDASPVIGAAAWWYDWSVEDYDALAGGLIAGHLIECGPYVSILSGRYAAQIADYPLPRPAGPTSLASRPISTTWST